ncbi:XdhC family protein [Ochrobactrum sp. GPK 3]|uniref:XdhC family protein n=1 Tax=Brucella sp. 22210 TaxID=3453892 RepID=UPI0031384E90
MDLFDITSPTNDSQDVLSLAEDWLRMGRQVALATVVQTWGSAPRRMGSQLIVDADGLFQGSVSGGCVEAEVLARAADVIRTGKPDRVESGVADETAWQAGLSCGGSIRIYIERADRNLLQALNAERRARRAVAVLTDLDTGTNHLIRKGGELPSAFQPTIGRNFAHGASTLVEADSKTLFCNMHLPNPRFEIIGAVHIAQVLAPMARMVGYDVDIIDPRTAFATRQRFPDSTLHAEWPQDVFSAYPLDPYTALAVMSHDPKIDDAALIAALQADCFYVGALGSRKSHAKRLQRLEMAGMDQAMLARIEGPIGLAIGATNPAEIAVSILARLVQSLRQPEMRLAA